VVPTIARGIETDESAGVDGGVANNRNVLVVFFSGLYWAKRMSAFDSAWPKVTVGVLLLIARLGALTGRHTREVK
jgi:hypothetical protein